MKLWDKEKSLTDNLKDLVTLVGLIGVVTTFIGSVFYFIFDDEIEKVKNSLSAPEKLEKIEFEIKQNSIRIVEDSLKFEKYLEDKTKTFAVGLRVDEEGQVWYRHTDGRLHRAYPDPEYSQWTEIDVYVWYDVFGNKQLCY